MYQHHVRASLAAAPLLLSGVALGQVSSTFDADLEGWGVYADGAIAHDPGFGNPGGSARMTDFGSGSYFGFNAPAAFLGDKSGCFGGMLTFDIWTNNSTAAGPTQPDVEIRGGGITIELDLPAPPGSTWTPRSIALDDSTNWRVGSLSGPAATNAEIQAVLADVTLLHIRGEFSTMTSDITYLDNVRLPCPACPADVNGDGALSPADFSAWIVAFNTQSAACDQNGDGLCTPADFSSWVANYNAGCN